MFFETVFNRMQEGGIISMTLILICLFLSAFLLIKSFVKRKKAVSKEKKRISLIKEIGLLALVIGVFSQLLGLIEALDAFDGIDGVSPNILAMGLKLSILPTLFGTLVFIISRIGVLVLSWTQKESI